MSFTLGIALALSSVLGGSSAQAAAQPQVMPQAQTVQQYVQTYFADEPVMIAIAGCESHDRQYDADGNVLKNPRSSAVGVFQIMASIHATSADDNFGLNINTLQGNAAYARYLYDKEGTAPWNNSKSCWGGSAASAPSASTTLAIANN